MTTIEQISKELTNHEKLRRICDEIWYEIDNKFWNYITNTEILLVKDQDFGDGGISIVDEREIIFTQEFMDKFGNTLFITNKKNYKDWWYYLLEHLSNPTDYLYNLLFNK